MPLTPEEQRELNRLEQKYGQAPAGAPSGLGAFLSDLAAAARVSAKSSGLPSPLGAAIPAPIRDVAVRTATTAALPTLLGAGGAAAGALTGPAAPVAIPLLEAAGSAGGEYLNQALGITPRSRTQIALAAGLPLGFRAIGAGVNALARRGLLPGAQGGLHELAAQEAPELAEKLRPTQNIDDLYAIVRASTDRVPLTGTAKALKDVSLQFNRLLPSQQPASIRALLDDVAVMTDQNQTGFAVMFERAKAMGAAARAASGTEQGIYKRLFKGMMEDLETAAGSIPALKRATSAFRKNLAADELLDLLLKAKGQPQRGTGVEVIAAGKVLKQLESSPQAEMFRAAVAKGDISRAEYTDLIDTLKTMNKIAALPPGRGQSFGFGRSGTVFLASYGLLKLAGADEQTARMLGGTAAGVPWLISRALMTEHGRQYIKAVARGGHYWSPSTLGVLANLVRAATVPGPDPRSLPSPSLEVLLPPVSEEAPPLDPSQLPAAP